MYELNDVSFLIPFRKDSDERVRNITIVIDYLKKYFNCHIMVHENAPTKVLDNGKIDDYFFEQNDNYIFHRTRILNTMAKKSSKPIVCLYDTDVLFDPSQFINAVEIIRSNRFDMVYPYDGRFYNIHRMEDVDNIQKNISLSDIKLENCALYHPNSVGGCIFFNKDVFKRCGYENENFVSWGYEDNARVAVHQKLGSRIARINGVLYHLNHPTSANSSNTKHDAYIKNQQEYAKVASLDPNSLRAYIASWSWK